MQCRICELRCDIGPGRSGRCGRYTSDGTEIREITPARYLAAVDTAIESMPLVHYHPGGTFLQVCTVGCNFKCPGCVSEILTHHIGAIRGQFQELSPKAVLDRAREKNCLGIMFCFNEPTVSFFTFICLAREAKRQGFLVGCATNGYMTDWALNRLIPHLDFVNVGLKGASLETCRDCGIPDAVPVFRNLRTLYQRGIHLEVSAVFRKSGESEVVQGAEFVASVSRDIPFQVMRFLPFGQTRADREPSVREAEALCLRLSKDLSHVYLFNTPGTSWLNSSCPRCGKLLLSRGFFGPMGANVHQAVPQGLCRCGFQLPLAGKIHSSRTETSGYFGGYRTINALNMVRAILALLGVKRKALMEEIMARVLGCDMIRELYSRLNRISSYLDTVDELAGMAGREERARIFRDYVESRVADIRLKVRGLSPPAVYASLGHPLIAMFPEKMESHLVTVAGGSLTNEMIRREDRPGITINPGQFCRMVPEIIILSDGAAWPPEDFTAFCRGHGLTAPAVAKGNIFWLNPFRCSTNPDWLLGLMALANLTHPVACTFDLEKEADRFYHEFYGHPFNGGILPAFPWEENHP